jgi:16S rRNA (guanine966-N2)-methyltransferase
VRVIAGEHRGRRLRTLAGRDLRPTLDRVREAIFSILGDEVPDARVLDLFAGTGALGIEALSRGAASAVFVDDDPRALAILVKNLEELRIAGRATIVRGSLPAALKSVLSAQGPFDIIFADPPYRTSLARDTLAGLLTEPWFPGWRCIVVETERGEDLTRTAPASVVADRRVYGDTAVVVLRPAADGTSRRDA